MQATTFDRAASLRSYLPRVLISWLAEAPGTTLREVDGTIVFVDISGFTKMSERLARSGKVGAEEVTEVIGSVFARLLSVAYGEGGGLIKFGGDALLLLFTGNEHPIQGARAAVGMRRALREIGAIDTTAGKVTLRMSVGLHSGTFQFFLVGETHRELIITGPAATETVSMEGTAVAGEILASQATARLLPPAVLSTPKGDGVLLRSLPKEAATELPVPEPSLEGVDPLSCIPVALREHVLSGETDPEHRHVTVAFIHYDGIDDLMREAGAEAVAYGLDELVCVTQVACDKQGVTFLGTDVDKDGGKIILVTGAPTAQSDDEERMLLAVRAIIDAGTTIPVRIGVNRGPVFSGAIGPPYRRTYTVMGDAVNLAARVMSKAEPGQALATAGVLDASRTLFELTELEPFMVKGKAKPVQAWSVGAPLGSRRREDSSTQLPLVGREREIEVLGGMLDAACNGEGRLIEITGEPGIGKTRLLGELHGRAEGLASLNATCEAYTSSSPYIVWRELLRELLDLRWEDPDEVVVDRLRERVSVLDPDLLPWLPLIALPFDVEVPPTPEVEVLAEEFRRAKLNEVVLAFLRLSLPGPALIEVEDAQHMDEASADLFGSLAGRVEESPWLVCIARRPAGGGFVAPEGAAITSLELGPIATSDLLLLATTANEEQPLTPHVLQTVAERSGGNPQFLLDLLDAAITTGSVEDLPDSVEAAATAQIDRLRSDDRTLLRRASVLGLSFHPRMIEWLDEGEAPSRPDDATWARLGGFFEDDGDGYLRFRRAVIRDSAYEGLPFRTRRRLHAAAGARFESEVEDTDEIAGILSLHFSLAGEYEKAWDYAKTAARRAETMFAHVEAASLFQRAINAGRQIHWLGEFELATVYEALAEAWWRAGEYQRAADANAAARKLAKGHAIVEARLLYRRSYVDEQLGRYTQALRWASRGQRVLDGVETLEAASLRAQLTAWYATVVFAQGRSKSAIGWAERAAAQSEASGNMDALARVYNVLDLAGVAIDRYSGGEYWRRALEICERLGDLRLQVIILSNLGLGARHEGRWPEAIGYWERAREVSNRIGDLVGESAAVENIGETLSEQGMYEKADELLRGALRVSTAVGYRELRGFCLNVLGQNTARAGRFDEAMSLLNEARDEYEAIGIHEGVLEADARIAECDVLRGNAEAALRLATEALARARSAEGGLVEAMLERVLGSALAQLGEMQKARAAFETSLDLARRRGGAQYDVALAADAIVRLATLTGDPVAPELRAEGLEMMERLQVVKVAEVPLQPRTPQAS